MGPIVSSRAIPRYWLRLTSPYSVISIDVEIPTWEDLRTCGCPSHALPSFPGNVLCHGKPTSICPYNQLRIGLPNSCPDFEYPSKLQTITPQKWVNIPFVWTSIGWLNNSAKNHPIKSNGRWPWNGPQSPRSWKLRALVKRGTGWRWPWCHSAPKVVSGLEHRWTLTGWTKAQSINLQVSMGWLKTDIQ